MEKLKFTHKAIASIGIVASLFFSHKKPTPEPLCKSREGAVDFTITGSNLDEKDVPNGAVNIRPISSIFKNEVIIILFSFPDTKNIYRRMHYDEYITKMRSGMLNPDFRDLPSCEEQSEAAKQSVEKL